GGADALGGKQVLGSVGNPMQRTAIAAGGNLPFRFSSLLERLRARNRYEGIYLWIDGFDTIHKAPHHLYRRKLPSLEQWRNFRNGLEEDFRSSHGSEPQDKFRRSLLEDPLDRRDGVADLKVTEGL